MSGCQSLIVTYTDRSMTHANALSEECIKSLSELKTEKIFLRSQSSGEIIEFFDQYLYYYILFIVCDSESNLFHTSKSVQISVIRHHLNVLIFN